MMDCKVKHRFETISAAFLALLLVVLPIQSLAAEGHARFGKGSGAITWPFAYEDAYFSQPGTQYNQGLATASLGMALSAFRKTDVPLEKSHENIKTFFEELGFEQPLFSQYHLQPTISTIATAMAHKPLGETTLLAVAVSGGGYKDEWKSNFSIGDSLHHIGFDSAAQQVLQRVTAYISQHRLRDKPVKIWVSGYSRAAATANRLGALLQDERLVKPENLYVYTFATPNVTKQADALEYKSIYNIVGAFDPVPMVPFADWGFKRYGITYVLPAPQLNSDYLLRVAPVAALFQRYTGTPFWSNHSGVSAISKLLSSLSESVTNTRDYTDKVQPMLMDLWAIRKEPLKMLTSFARHMVFKDSSLRGVLSNMFAIATNSLGENLVQEAGFAQNQWQEDKSLTDNLAREHFPEGYMAWMSAYDSLEKMISPTLFYRQLTLEGFDDFQVLDEAGNVFFYFRFNEDGQVEQSLDSALYFPQAGNAMVLSLPADAAYTLKARTDQYGVSMLRLREGTAGLTRMQVYEQKDVVLPHGTTWQLALPVITEQAAPGASTYTLAGDHISHSLVYQENARALSDDEKNSSFSAVFTQNLLIGVAVLLLIVVLLLFTVFLAIRAARRHNHKHYLARCGTPLPRPRLKGNFLTRAHKHKVPLKVLALVLLGTGISILVVTTRMMMAWTAEIQLIHQRSLFLFTLMYYVPFGVLLFCCGVPALVTGVYTLLWLCDDYVLCTSRLHARIALLFTLGLAAVLTLPAYGYFSLTLLIATPLQLLCLLISLHLMRRVLKHRRKARTQKSLPKAASS